MILFKRSLKKVGLPPGTLTVPHERESQKPVITLFQYGDAELVEKTISVAEIATLQKSTQVTWLNVDGLSDIEVFRSVGENFNIHNLSLEDVLNLDHRPKIEEHGNYTLLIVKMIDFNAESNEIDIEQVSLVLQENMVITFQEKTGDVFTSIRERIRDNKGRIRKRGADYLAYALFDAIVDNYFIVFEQLGEKITACENEVIDNPQPSTSSKIYALRNKLILLRRAIWPLRDVVNELRKNESDLYKEETRLYFKDLYDHTVQLIEAIETYRDMLSGLLDGYHNAVSNRMNEIMKVLTIISTLFIPLGFLAGLYGMNFKNMPELEWPFGYPLLVLVMVLVVSGLLLFFRRKKWL